MLYKNIIDGRRQALDLGDLAADELINPEDGILRDFEMTDN